MVRYFYFMIKHSFVIVFAFSTVLFGQVNSVLYPDVTVLANDAAGITLEFRPHYLADRVITADRMVYTVPQFAFESASLRNQPGAQDIRSRVIPLALPSYSGNTVTVTASDFENVTGYSLAPVPAVTLTDGEGAQTRTYRDEFRSRSEFIPTAVAEIGSIGSMKGLVFGNLVISPYQFQSASKTLRRYSRIVVRVEYGPHDAVTDASGNEHWAENALLNFQRAKQWSPVRRALKSTAPSSVLASGTWVKIETAEEGIYKLDAPYLRSIGLEPVSRPLTDVKVFGGDGRNLPENLATPRSADLPQLAPEYVDKNSNGIFDADDYILFYAQGVTGWTYDPVQKQFSHYGNPYTFSNYYFVSLGAAAPVKSVQNVSVTNAVPDSLRTVRGKAVFDEDKYNFDQSGQDWVSAPINAGETRTVSTKLHGWVAGTPVTYQYVVYARATENTTMSVDEGSQSLGTASFAYVQFDEYHYFASPDTRQFTITPLLTDQRSMVKFKYNSTSNISTAYIGWLRMFYTMQLTAVGNALAFTAPDTSGTVAFDIDGFTRNDITAYEVSGFHSVRKVQYQLQQQTGAVVLKDTASAGSVRRYYLCTPDQFKTPKSAVKIGNTNLHAQTGAEFVIITHNDFTAEALRLKQHKESLPGAKRISTTVVDVDSIFNEFGLGMPDPTAVRDFIRYAVEQWTIKPKYVLFFGDASYDYRGLLKLDRSFVPAYETPESNIKISTYAIEDYFSYINPLTGPTVALAHGRLTPKTRDEAKTLVDKIIQYETGMQKGPWKNKVTLVADDMWTPANAFESDHIYQTETIAQMAVNRGFDVKRIYMEEYPTVFASTGRRKPAVREAILDMINVKGSVLLNFVGHGNPKLWAHENVLTQDDVRNYFVNGDKLTFIVAATCDWGRFEEAGETSSAEDVVLSKKGGAIGVFSANRAVYSSENALINQKFYEYLMSVSPSMRLGDAYMLAKNSLVSYSYLENKQKYFLLGDPTMTLAAPEGSIVIDSILAAAGGKADSLRALEKITIKGTVRDSANAVMTGFNGTATLTVNDAEFKHFVPPVSSRISGDDYFSYQENGSVIYSGQASITNGVMSASFIVPKDISYTNKNGRASVYFSGAGFDGRGYDKTFVVGGTNPSAPADSAGPEITIYFDDPGFRSGDLVSENPTLFVSLKDSNGINSSTRGIGHRLEAWIDGSAKSMDLTGYYQGKTDSYKEGSASLALTDLPEGNHTISVRAWDVYNNSSTAEASFVVASGSSLSIQQLFNIPNPVSTTTAFTFQHNQSIPIDVTIYIYTVSGRLVHTIERPAVPDRFVKIDWNRRDRDGDEVGNGVYFYKVTAKTIDGRFTSEAVGKLAVVR
jgi:hypothetical protein